jgi:hypothetical protein
MRFLENENENEVYVGTLAGGVAGSTDNYRQLQVLWCYTAPTQYAVVSGLSQVAIHCWEKGKGKGERKREGSI